MTFIVKPEFVCELLDRLTGVLEQVGPQAEMYEFFFRQCMTPDEIKELEKHRT